MKKPEPMNPTENNQALEQIRKILVGKLAEENQAKISDLNNDLSRTSSQLEKSIEKLSKTISEGLKKQADGLRQLEKEFQKSTGEVRKDIEQLDAKLKTLEKRASDLESDPVGDVRQQTQESIEELRESLAQTKLSTDQHIVKLTSAIEANKVGREDLAQMFSQISKALGKPSA